MTRLAPDIFFECPKCKQIIYKESYLGLGYFYGIEYSDGYESSGYTPIIQCYSCGRIFWVRDAIEVQSYKVTMNPKYKGYSSLDRSDRKYINAEKNLYLGIFELLSVLDNNNYNSKEDEIYIRKNIWWIFNSGLRNNIAVYLEQMKKNEPKYIIFLFKLFAKYYHPFKFKNDDERDKWYLQIKDLKNMMDLNDKNHLRILKEIEFEYSSGDYKTFKETIRTLNFDQTLNLDIARLKWLEKIEFNENDIQIPPMFDWGDPKENERMKKIWSENLIQLKRLLNKNNNYQKLLIAEIHRNLGEFQECLEVIESINTKKKHEGIKNIYRNECEKRNSYVFEFYKTDFEWGLLIHDFHSSY